MKFFRRKRKPRIDPAIARWIVDFREERINERPGQRYRVPDSITITRDGYECWNCGAELEGGPQECWQCGVDQ